MLPHRIRTYINNITELFMYKEWKSILRYLCFVGTEHFHDINSYYLKKYISVVLKINCHPLELNTHGVFMSGV